MSASGETPVRGRWPRSAAALAGAGVFLVCVAILVDVVRPRRARPASAASEESPATVTTETAELKREPSSQSEALARLSRGARVTVIAERGRWRQSRAASGEVGFLPADTLETDPEKEARQRRAKKILSFPAVFGVVAEETDVLLAPFPLAARAGRLEKGETISIHAVDHAYYAFRSRDAGVAFVNSADVDLVPPDPRRPAIVAEGGKGIKDIKVTDLAAAQVPPEEADGQEALGPPNPRSETPGPGEEPLEPPVLTSKVDPQYPEVARRAGVEGTVVLDTTISETGRVTDVRVLRGLPLGVSEAAIEAVRRWQYRPARGREGPVASHKVVRIVFALGG